MVFTSSVVVVCGSTELPPVVVGVSGFGLFSMGGSSFGGVVLITPDLPSALSMFASSMLLSA
jgi:hypothetical protein